MGHGGILEDSPFGIESKKLAMWLFIVADAATFGALLFGYGLRVGSPNWIRPFAFFLTILNGVASMTAVLLTSSLTMLAGVRAARAGAGGGGRPSGGLRSRRCSGSCSWCFTCESGSICSPTAGPFAKSVGRIPPLRRNLLRHHRPPPVACDHGGHRHCGHRPWFPPRALQRRPCGHHAPYWHFVDLVWMFVFPLVYLMNAR